MQTNSSDIKQELIEVSKIAEAKGLANALEGNLSIIDRQSGLMYITPSACKKDTLTPEMIAVMKEDEQVEGSKKRSSEYLLHKIVLNARPDCNAAVHFHPEFLTAYAMSNQSISIRCSTTFALIVGKDIPCIPYGRPGTPHIADGLPEVIKNHDIVLLENHGIICVGETLEKACAMVESIECAIKSYSIAKMLGMTPSDIPQEEYDQISVR